MSNAVPDDVRQILTTSLGVSRETIAQIERYVATLLQWQKAINLIGPATQDDIWRRHILDCAQAAPLFAQSDENILDMGSGGGLPGLVLAIILQRQITLVESDQRKATFLREAARAAACPVRVHAQRIERFEQDGFDVVTARALAPLDRLLGWAMPKLRNGGRIIAFKGRSWAEELTAAQEKWHIQVQTQSSITAHDAKILIIHPQDHRRTNDQPAISGDH